MSSISGSIIGGIAQLGSTLIGTSAAKKENRKEREFNAQQAQLNRDFQTQERIAAQEWNEQMWNKNNEYNSASSQIHRMLEAGINPNAAFGNGYTSAEAAAPTTTPQAGSQASYSSGLGATLLSTLSQQALTLAQVENIKAQTDNQKYELTWNKMTENERFDMLVNMNKEKLASIKKTLSDVGINDFNKDLQERTFAWFAKRSEAELKIINEQLNNLRIQYQDVLASIDLKEANIQGIFADIRNKDKQNELYDANIQQSKEQANLIGKQASGQETANMLQQMIYDYSAVTAIPVGAPESHVLFTLWAAGEQNAFSDKLTMADYQNASNPASKYQAGKDLSRRANYEDYSSYKDRYGRKYNNRKFRPSWGTTYTK